MESFTLKSPENVDIVADHNEATSFGKVQLSATEKDQ